MIQLSKVAPAAIAITPYDRAHLSTYLRLFDADREGASWTEAARLVFGDAAEPEAAGLKQQHESHLARAKWLVESGYLRLAEAVDK